jgi:ribosome modulation factor
VNPAETQARAIEDGFLAGVDGTFDNPSYKQLDLRMLWRGGWMAGRKCLPLMRGKLDEHRHQTILFRWAEALCGARPELDLMYAVPNGGKRDPVTAAKLQQEGVKAGVPDICLPVPRKGYAALYIEMKTPTGRVRADQQIWMDRLEAQGNRALVCFGWREAVEVISQYLEIED